jgi:hypothetical protein
VGVGGRGCLPCRFWRRLITFFQDPACRFGVISLTLFNVCIHCGLSLQYHRTFFVVSFETCSAVIMLFIRLCAEVCVQLWILSLGVMDTESNEIFNANCAEYPTPMQELTMCGEKVRKSLIFPQRSGDPTRVLTVLWIRIRWDRHRYGGS